MSKNDDRILELKKQIEIKKKSISEKKVRFIPETNCVLNMDGMTICNPCFPSGRGRKVRSDVQPPE